GGLDGGHVDALTRTGGYAKAGRVERTGAVERAGAGGEILVDDQRTVEPALRAAAQHLGQYLEREGVLFARGAVARRQIAAGPRRLAHSRVLEDDAPRRFLRRILRAHSRRNRTRRDRAVVFLGQRLDLVDRYIAGEDQHGVVGRVVLAIPG